MERKVEWTSGPRLHRPASAEAAPRTCGQKWELVMTVQPSQILDAVKTFNSSAAAVPFAFGLLLIQALEEFVGQELWRCGSVRDVQRGRRGLDGLHHTVEQPLSEGRAAGRGTGRCIRTEDGGQSQGQSKGGL